MTLKWGIVSTGRIATQFSQDLRHVEEAQLYGVAARDINNAKAFQAEHGIKRCYESYEAMFNDSEIDVVYIATPHSLHFEHAKMALEAGKHVLCEKPVTISSEEMRQLSAMAQKHHRFFMEAMWTYFLPAINQAKSWVDAGLIGKIKHIRADFGYPLEYHESKREYDAKLGGGCLLELGIYPLALTHFFLGEVETRDMVVNKSLAPNGVENDVTMLIQHDDTLVNISASYQCKLPNFAYIIGEKGYIEIPDFWRTNQCSRYVLEDKVEHFKAERTTWGFDYEAREVTRLIKSGQWQSAVMPHSTSLWLQRVMEQIKAS